MPREGILLFKLLDLNSLEDTVTFSSEAFYERVRRVVKKDSLFKTWFSRTSVQRLDSGSIVLQVASDLAKDWIEKKYFKAIASEVEELWSCELELVLASTTVVVESDLAENTGSKKRTQRSEAPREDAERSGGTVLDSKGAGRSGYSFKGFITGPENQLAYTAAHGLATGSAHVHTPLVLIGGHGMGKTHLASCILDAYPAHQVLSWHAEEFANAYIQAMQSGELDRFRAQIRSKKVVVIEDLDFFLEGSKTKTKEELLNSLKVLKRDRRQIILTSHEPAFSYQASAPKLSSFLMGGLTVKLEGMTSYSRSKMIDHYLEEFGCGLREKSIEFLKTISFKNPRELKGALKQVAAYAVLKDQKLPESVLKDILSDHLRAAGESLGGTQEMQDLHSIAKAVSQAYGVGVQKLLSTSREQYVTLARHVAESLSYDFHYTLKEIGQFYGGRKHQSVLWGIKKVGVRREKDLDFHRSYLKLHGELKASLKQ